MGWILTENEPPPKDGTLVLLFLADWTKNGTWVAPVVGLWAEFHPNAKGKACWRTPTGNKIGGPKWEPTMWARIPTPKDREEKGGE